MSAVPGIMAEAMAQLIDAVDPVREAVVGYHAGLIARGLSSAAADAMAVQLHGHLMDVAFRSTKT